MLIWLNYLLGCAGRARRQASGCRLLNRRCPGAGSVAESRLGSSDRMEIANMRLLAPGVLALLTWSAATLAPAAADTRFQRWLEELRLEARATGMRREILDRALTGIRPIPRVVELDRRQPEFTLTFREYMDRVVPEARVRRGRAKLRENGPLIGRIARTYGVQERFIVAFWGIETDFGRVTGSFPVVASLVTLAYDGRRSAFFRRELLNALRILDEGHVEVSAMLGSWAGAMGQPQFMPSTFVAFAVDGDGDGRKDIWTSKADVFASAANYLSKSGWKGDPNLGPAGAVARRIRRRSRRSGRSSSESGRGKSSAFDDPTVPLCRPGICRPPSFSRTGRTALRSWFYNNYRTILKWNRSTFFAIAVGSLADGIGDG